MIVGAPGWEDDATGEGAASVYLGSAAGLSATPAWSAEGDAVSAGFGSVVASAGDVNGDGFDDVVVGAERYDVATADEGAAFVFLGSAGPSPTPSWTVFGDQADGRLGGAVASAGDVNGDGYDDLLIGAKDYTHGHYREGVALLYLGSATGLAAAPTWLGESNQDESYGDDGPEFASAVAGAGDVDGDGRADVVVGAPLFDGLAYDGGRVWAWLGATP